MKGLQKRTGERSRRDTSPSVLVVGGELAYGVATVLDESATVSFVTADEALADRVAGGTVTIHTGDVTDASVLAAPDVDADAAVVACEFDRRTLLVAQLLRGCCDVDTVVASVVNGTYREAFEGTGVTTVDLGEAFAGVVGQALPETLTGH